MGVQDDARAAPSAAPSTAAISAALAAGGAAAMAAATSVLLPPALEGHSEGRMIAWVLLAVAGLGTVLCLYLMLIWGLAAVVLTAGPASRSGVALLAALRLLAPHVARRITLGAAVATTATGMVLVPATAASQEAASDTPPPAFTMSAELNPSTPTGDDPEPGAGAPASSQDEDSGSMPLPSLGWGEAPEAPPPASSAAGPQNSPDAAGTPSSDSPDAPSGVEDSPDSSATSSPSPVTVTVRSGDTLWSLTDDLLGPAPDDSAEIAAAWPRFHEANRDVIGTDPNLLEPGQELTVPSTLSSQEQS